VQVGGVIHNERQWLTTTTLPPLQDRVQMQGVERADESNEYSLNRCAAEEDLIEYILKEEAFADHTIHCRARELCSCLCMSRLKAPSCSRLSAQHHLSRIDANSSQRIKHRRWQTSRLPGW
jgi:hypothetical protein